MAERSKGPSIISFDDPIHGKGEFAIDVTTSIATNLSAAVTKFPIEGRENITDHVQPAPLTLSLKCMISESPSAGALTLASTLASSIIGSAIPNKLSSGFARALTGAAVTAIASQIGKGSDDNDNDAGFKDLLTTRSIADTEYPKKAMLGLARMFQAGTLFTLRTFFNSGLYTNMVMTSLSFSQTSKEGDSLSFSMTCEKVKTVKAFSFATNLELKASDPAGGSLAKVKDKDKVTPKETKDPKENTSSLFDGYTEGKKVLGL